MDEQKYKEIKQLATDFVQFYKKEILEQIKNKEPYSS